jgi:hypothetical protein
MGSQTKGVAILIFWEAQAMSGKKFGDQKVRWGGGGNEEVRLAFSQ